MSDGYGTTEYESYMRGKRYNEEVREERKKRSMSARHKSAWIRAARASFKPVDRDNCAVCGMYKEISQAHHLLPLDIQYEIGLRDACHKFVWLCPNHHAIVHRNIDYLLQRLLRDKRGIWYQKVVIAEHDLSFSTISSKIGALGIELYTAFVKELGSQLINEENNNE